jgi:GNAT superfamily N-acetyltransferase
LLAEATDLLSVERRSLKDSPYTPEEIFCILRRPEQYAYIAYLNDVAVGFCSCIETPTSRGNRLEIDMLGVVPAHRRRGLSSQLVAYSVRQAVERKVTRFRAIVALDNIASQRTFYRAGFDASPHPFAMAIHRIRGQTPVPFLPKGWGWHMASEGKFDPYGKAGQPFSAVGRGHDVYWLANAKGETVAMAECLRVCTMAYRGLWLERLWARSKRACASMAHGLVEHAKTLNLDEAGYLIPQECAGDQRLPFISEGYSIVGEYIRFDKALESHEQPGLL